MKIQNSVLSTIATSLGAAIFIFTGSPSHAADGRDVASLHGAALAKARHGRTTLPSFVRVLSYDEMMRLSKTKRATYLRSLRAMMRDLDRTSKTASLDGVTRSQIAALLSMFESEALAAETPGVPFKDGDKVTCGTGFTPIHPRSMGYGPDSTDSDAGNYLCSVRAMRSATSCPGNTIPVSQDATTGAFFCGTPASYGKLTDIQKSNARANMASALKNSVANDAFNNPKFESQEKIRARIAQTARLTGGRNRAGDALPFKYPAGVKPPALLAKPAAAAGSAAGSATTNADAATKPGRMSAATYADRPPIIDAKAPETIPLINAPPAPKFGADGKVIANADAPSGKPTTPPPPGAQPPPDAPGQQKVAPVPAGQPHGKEDKASGSAATDAPSTDATDKDGSKGTTDVVVAPTGKTTDAAADTKSCAPDSETPKTCNATEIEAARRKYATDPDQDCIYAGSISTYEGGTKRAYHCQAPHDFCFSGACEDATGDHAKADYSCSASQVICNPLLFGVQKDKSPFCISKNAHATSACDEIADDSAVSPLDEKHAGIREAWNDFADRLFKMCHSNQTAAALHCNECDIISKRLFAMNLAARDVKNCGAAIKYEASNCDADGACSVRPGQGDPDNRKARGTGKVTENALATPETREPASETPSPKRSWSPYRE